MKLASLWVLSFALAACAADSSPGDGAVASAPEGRWKLEDARDADGGRIEALFPQGMATRTLELEADTLLARGGCNSISGYHRIDAQGRLVIARLTWTLVSCSDELERADQAFRGLLEGTAEWTIEESYPERLRMQYTDGHSSVWTADVAPPP
ncbi:MAG TPA: META domain-containing protein [Polyangiaceae bacterium]|nr:META domain-containing protein [Polyangiaceae bacterium]